MGHIPFLQNGSSMICSAQFGAERGVDLLQIRNTKFRGEILGNFSTVLRPRGTLIPLHQECSAVEFCSRILQQLSPKCRVARPQALLLTTRVAPCPGNLHLSKNIFHFFMFEIFGISF